MELSRSGLRLVNVAQQSIGFLVGSVVMRVGLMVGIVFCIGKRISVYVHLFY